MIALGNRYGGQQCLVVGVIVRLRISMQMIDGFFLRFRPYAFTGDVGTRAGLRWLCLPDALKDSAQNYIRLH